jgi:hypothetical protein
VRVEGEARALPTRDTLLWGGRLRLAKPWRRLHLDVDVGAGYASVATELGDVKLQTASVGLGFGPRISTTTAVVDLGLRAEAGWARVHGESELLDVRAQAGSELTASAGLRASVELPAQSPIRPSLALECGSVLRGVRGEANGRSVVGMTGYYLLAALGIGVVP